MTPRPPFSVHRYLRSENQGTLIGPEALESSKPSVAGSRVPTYNERSITQVGARNTYVSSFFFGGFDSFLYVLLHPPLSSTSTQLSATLSRISKPNPSDMHSLSTTSPTFYCDIWKPSNAHPTPLSARAVSSSSRAK